MHAEMVTQSSTQVLLLALCLSPVCCQELERDTYLEKYNSISSMLIPVLCILGAVVTMMVCSIGSVMLCVSLLVADLEEEEGEETSVLQSGSDISSRETVKSTKHKNDDPFNNLAASGSAIQLAVKVEAVDGYSEDKMQQVKSDDVFSLNLNDIAIELPLEKSDDSSTPNSEDLAIKPPPAPAKSNDIFDVIVNIEPHNSSNTLGKTAKMFLQEEEMLKGGARTGDMHGNDRSVEGMLSLLLGRGKSQYSPRNLCEISKKVEDVSQLKTPKELGAVNCSNHKHKNLIIRG